MSTPEEIAADLARGRCTEIRHELQAVGVTFDPADVFQPVKAQGGVVKIAHNHGAMIELAGDVPNLLYGRVDLEIGEEYSYAEPRTDPGKPLSMVKYSYRILYMPEIVIESGTLQSAGREHRGDLLLTQRRHYRFDGEERATWETKSLKYRNQHNVHHFHIGAGEFIRWPIAGRPSVLAVVCFALISFNYDEWLRHARARPAVLAATQTLLPHVAAP